MQVDEDVRDHVPCSSQAVETTVRISTAGIIWGLTTGPYNARKLGLIGLACSSFVAKSVVSSGFQSGLFAGIYCSTRCGLQRYRMKNDVLNASMAGAFTGALFSARTRSLKHFLGFTTFISAIATAAEY